MKDDRSVIKYRVYLNRELILDEEGQMPGIEGFVEKLQAEGWMDSEGICLVSFDFDYFASLKPDNCFFEYCATLMN